MDWVPWLQRAVSASKNPEARARLQRCRSLALAEPQSGLSLNCPAAAHSLDEYEREADNFQREAGLNNYANSALKLASGCVNRAATWQSGVTAAAVANFLAPCRLAAAACACHQPGLRLGDPLDAEAELQLCCPPATAAVDADGSGGHSNAKQSHGNGQHGNGQHGNGQHGNGQHGNGQHGNGQHGNGQHGNGRHAGSSLQSQGYRGKGLPFNQRQERQDAAPAVRQRQDGAFGHQQHRQDAAFGQQQHRQDAGKSFVTARRQLQLDAAKKPGVVKRSLGTSRRTPTSGFVSPFVRQESEEQRQRPPAGEEAQEEEEEPAIEDERLKGFDPKLVETIMREVMSHGASVGWDDIAGLEFAKATIKEIIVFPMLRPDIFTGIRGPPKGLLLFGPPGTGKSLIGRCIASVSGATFFNISASSLTSKWVGEGEKLVRALFAVARVRSPAVIFIDEVDSLLSARSESEHESSRRMKTEFLVQLDGIGTDAEERLLVIGATNRPQELDDAARRRFVKRLHVPLPEAAGRRQIVQRMLAGELHELGDADVDRIVEATEGYSGADVANLVREAALGPVRSIPIRDIRSISVSAVRPIGLADFEEALTQVRASVLPADLDQYVRWNDSYGSYRRMC